MRDAMTEAFFFTTYGSPRDEDGRRAASAAFAELLGAAGDPDAAGQRRLARLDGLFGAKLPLASCAVAAMIVAARRKSPQASVT